MEEALRRAFRRRRAARRRVGWLALAAALALLAVWPLSRRGTPPPPAPSIARPARPTPQGPAVASAQPPAAVRAARIAGEKARAPRSRATVVIVEPRQAELLARLAEDLQRRPPGAGLFSGAPRVLASSVPVAVLPADAPGTPTLAAGLGSVPRYQGDWETVSGVWPAVQLSASSMGR